MGGGCEAFKADRPGSKSPVSILALTKHESRTNHIYQKSAAAVLDVELVAADLWRKLLSTLPKLKRRPPHTIDIRELLLVILLQFWSSSRPRSIAPIRGTGWSCGCRKGKGWRLSLLRTSAIGVEDELLEGLR